MSRLCASLTSVISCIALSLVPLPAQERKKPIAEVAHSEGRIMWTPIESFAQLTLRILDPTGAVSEEAFGPGEEIYFDTIGLADGAYRWQLLAELSPQQAADEFLASPAKPVVSRELRDPVKSKGKSHGRPAIQSGTFSILDGVSSLPSLLQDESHAAFRQVLNEDLIVRGRQCVGLDCPNNPQFFDSELLIMDPVARLTFDDTSNDPFPKNDWQLLTNDTVSGGIDKFSIKDCGLSGPLCSGNEVFTVEAGAPQGALYVDSFGRMGLNTTMPLEELHMIEGRSPTMRLEQTSPPYAWEIIANESAFFILDDVSRTFPFIIQSGAARGTLVVGRIKDSVGIGTESPQAKLHVRGDDATPFDGNHIRLRAENLSLTEISRTMVELVNHGGVAIYFEDTSSNLRWQTLALGGEFFISRLGTGGTELRLRDTGDLFIKGILTQGSDRNSKRDIEPVDVENVLERVADMPISTWSYKTDAQGVRHLGPMAQDFHAAFGLGEDERSIATLDTSGVALAAIQALHRQVEELRTHDTAGSEAANEPSPAIEVLADAVERLTQRVAELETALAQAQGNQ